VSDARVLPALKQPQTGGKLPPGLPQQEPARQRVLVPQRPGPQQPPPKGWEF
jgi:hypothetical protein